MNNSEDSSIVNLKIVMVGIVFLVLFGWLSCQPETADASGRSPQIRLDLYNGKGQHIAGKETRKSLKADLGHVSCLFKYQAKYRRYTVTCKTKEGVVLHEGASSCRKTDKQPVTFTVSGKDEEGSRRYYFIWHCIPTREV